MSRLAAVAALALAARAAAAPGGAAVAAPPAPSREAAAGFGEIAVQAPPGRPERVVILLAGATGLDAGAREVAAVLVAGGALVVGVDARAWLAARPPGRCAYPAGDLEELAQGVEKRRGLDAYVHPALVGYGVGAAVAWAALAQGPAGTFLGGVAVAPCPDRALPVRLCAPHGPPPRALAGGDLPALGPPRAPIEVIGGSGDASCPAAAAERLAAALSARFTEVPGAARTPSASARAVAAALARIAPAAAPAPAPAPPTQWSGPAAPVGDLPVVEVRAARPGTRLAVLLTGDGGWVGIDKALAAAFADEGVAVVGLDSLRYFWKRRTPDETARDVARIVDHYRAAWGLDEVLLVGYSRGADIVPIVAGRLSPDERARLALVAMLGPSTFAELEVHAIDLFTSKRRAGAIPTEDAVRGLAGEVPVLCVHGSDEHDSLCPRLRDLPWVKDLLLSGGHHFDGAYRELAAQVLAAARPPAPPRPSPR